MESDKIIKYICDEHNINLKDFLKIISDDNTIYFFNYIFTRDFFNFKKRIRFVRYSDNNEYVHVFITNLKVSNVFKHPVVGEKKVYSSEKIIKLIYDDIIKYIYRLDKIKKIVNNIK